MRINFMKIKVTCGSFNYYDSYCLEVSGRGLGVCVNHLTVVHYEGGPMLPSHGERLRVTMLPRSDLFTHQRANKRRKGGGASWGLCVA